MLNWANEPWTRRWDGTARKDGSVLIEQDYGDVKMWERHFQYLTRFFRHPNYIRVEGCPAFAVYDPLGNTVLTRMYAVWRLLAKKTEGVGCIFIVGFQTFERSKALIGGKTADKILDAVAEFQPHTGFDLMQHGTSPRLHPKSHYWGTLSGWDNSPRNFVSPATARFERDPSAFVKNFKDAVLRVAKRTISDPNPRGDNFMIVNPWNEWGENSVLEPNSVYGEVCSRL
jgi:hypothetical protein